MKTGRMALIAALVLANPVLAGNEAYEKAMKALETRDFATGLGYLETALAQDPDNMQFASEYRMAIIRQAKQLHPKEGRPADYERCLKFFERLAANSPTAANAWLNYGFAVVDKIPAAGAISQVILANTALDYFTKSIEARPSWIGYYTRGASYLFWPKIFGRAPLAVADLEKAMKLQKIGPPKSVYVRGYIGLGDGYWKTDKLERARKTWAEGLKLYPDSQQLKDRLARKGDDLKDYLDDALDPSKRVDTDLKELWMIK